MMTNLFFLFDPSSIFGVSLNWLSTFLGLLMIPSINWMKPPRYNIFWNTILTNLHKEYKTLLGPSGHNGSIFIFISLFSLIRFNFMGLFPYIFTSASHLTLTLTLALPLWISFMMYGWINHTQHMFVHLVPSGTPAILMPFMANMIAGHLLLTLFGNTGPSLSLMQNKILLITQIALLVLESAVAMIITIFFFNNY